MTSGAPTRRSAGGSRDAGHPDALSPGGCSRDGAGDDRDSVGGRYWPYPADDGQDSADGRHRGRRHRRDTTGGAEGNERLTALTGMVLLVLFAAEGVTILSLRRLLTLHFFVGMLVIGPVALKACSTIYRDWCPASPQAGTPGRRARPRPVPPPRRQPGGRGVSARVRRRRAAAVLLVLIAGVATWIVVSPGTPTLPRRHALSSAPVAAAHGLAAAEAGLMPWHLAVPISREVAVAAPGNRLIVVGGLTAGGTSVNGIYAFGAATGAARDLGALRTRGHDAAAAVIGGRVLIFGGGSAASTAAVQAFALRGPRGGAAAGEGSVAVGSVHQYLTTTAPVSPR